MPEVFGFDAFSPSEIATRVETIGVAKARLPLLSMLMLSVMAGAFIGLGSLYFFRSKRPAMDAATQPAASGYVEMGGKPSGGGPAAEIAAEASENCECDRPFVAGRRRPVAISR